MAIFDFSSVLTNYNLKDEKYKGKSIQAGLSGGYK